MENQEVHDPQNVYTYFPNSTQAPVDSSSLNLNTSGDNLPKLQSFEKRQAGTTRRENNLPFSTQAWSLFTSPTTGFQSDTEGPMGMLKLEAEWNMRLMSRTLEVSQALMFSLKSSKPSKRPLLNCSGWNNRKASILNVNQNV